MIKLNASFGQWMTPSWAAQELVDRYFADLSSTDLVLEPSCGLGAFLQAIPDVVPAIGVEIDPELARQAEVITGRRVIVGDFRYVPLAGVAPTVIVGNPPYRVRLISAFLARAAGLLSDGGRCGLLLPAYAMQTHSRVVRWNQTWSMASDLIPRRLFPQLRLPLVFVQFRKEHVRTLVGFALYEQAVAVGNLSSEAKLVLASGRPGRSVWRAVVEWALEELGGRATLAEIYAKIEPRRPTANAFWREKTRQSLQVWARPMGRGVWALPERVA